MKLILGKNDPEIHEHFVSMLPSAAEAMLDRLIQANKDAQAAEDRGDYENRQRALSRANRATHLLRVCYEALGVEGAEQDNPIWMKRQK